MAGSDRAAGVIRGISLREENDQSIPSIYKIYSLSLIYAVKWTDILAFYIDLGALTIQQLQARHSRTHPVNFEPCVEDEQIDFPIRFISRPDSEGTNLAWWRFGATSR